MKTTVIQLTIKHEKPLPDLGALVAGRAWTIAGVSFVQEQTFTLIEADAYRKALDAGLAAPSRIEPTPPPAIENPHRWLNTQ